MKLYHQINGKEKTKITLFVNLYEWAIHHFAEKSCDVVEYAPQFWWEYDLENENPEGIYTIDNRVIWYQGEGLYKLQGNGDLPEVLMLKSDKSISYDNWRAWTEVN